MRKAYYPNTRFSSGLDFSVTSAIDPERKQSLSRSSAAVRHRPFQEHNQAVWAADVSAVKQRRRAERGVRSHASDRHRMAETR